MHDIVNRLKLLAKKLMYVRSITNQAGVTQELDLALVEVFAIGDAAGKHIKQEDV